MIAFSTAVFVGRCWKMFGTYFVKIWWEDTVAGRETAVSGGVRASEGAATAALPGGGESPPSRAGRASGEPAPAGFFPSHAPRNCPRIDSEGP